MRYYWEALQANDPSIIPICLSEESDQMTIQLFYSSAFDMSYFVIIYNSLYGADPGKLIDCYVSVSEPVYLASNMYILTKEAKDKFIEIVKNKWQQVVAFGKKVPNEIPDYSVLDTTDMEYRLRMDHLLESLPDYSVKDAIQVYQSDTASLYLYDKDNPYFRFNLWNEEENGFIEFCISATSPMYFDKYYYHRFYEEDKQIFISLVKSKWHNISTSVNFENSVPKIMPDYSLLETIG